MSIKVMIIDGRSDFRSLLSHHITTHWPDAIITEFDPIAAGYLPDEFSGAGNDIVLLGNELGERDGLDVLRQFLRTAGFPAVAFFGSKHDRAKAEKLGEKECNQRHPTESTGETDGQRHRTTKDSLEILDG